MPKLREGVTTGTCAAAALKGALTLWQSGSLPGEVSVETPQGLWLTVPLSGGGLAPGGAWGSVRKDAGDDPDVTHGAEIHASFTLTGEPGCRWLAGEGVGTVTRAGLFVPVGEPAINEGPRVMMKKALAEFLPLTQGVAITVSIPGGEELAKKTLNRMLGIEGGLSVIGTTGIVRPMSEEALRSSLTRQYDIMLAAGVTLPVLVPGKIGERLATDAGIEQRKIAQTSNFIGFMLEEAAERGWREILVLGHIGKIIKLSGGIFQTHSHVADARQEIFAAYLALLGAPQALIEAALSANTAEKIAAEVDAAGFTAVYDLLAERAATRSFWHLKEKAAVGVALFDIKGRFLGADPSARTWAKERAWKFGKTAAAD